MAHVIENNWIHLEFSEDCSLLSFRNRETGTELAVPHGLWRLVCSCGERQEVELSAARSSAIFSAGEDTFRIDYNDPASPRGEKLAVRVSICGRLQHADLHLSITVVNDMPMGRSLKSVISR